MNAADNDLTAEQWLALQESWEGCAYCGTDGPGLQKDCVLALSRGGRYTIDNVVPACRSCNASKSNDEVTGWMRRKKLDERSFLLRHRDISRDIVERFADETPEEQVEDSVEQTLDPAPEPTH